MQPASSPRLLICMCSCCRTSRRRRCYRRRRHFFFRATSRWHCRSPPSSPESVESVSCGRLIQRGPAPRAGSKSFSFSHWSPPRRSPRRAESGCVWGRRSFPHGSRGARGSSAPYWLPCARRWRAARHSISERGFEAGRRSSDDGLTRIGASPSHFTRS